MSQGTDSDGATTNMTRRGTDGVHRGTDVQLTAREPHLGSDQGRPHCSHGGGSFGPLPLVLVPDSLAFRWAGSRPETLRRCRSRVGGGRPSTAPGARSTNRYGSLISSGSAADSVHHDPDAGAAKPGNGMYSLVEHLFRSGR